MQIIAGDSDRTMFRSVVCGQRIFFRKLIEKVLKIEIPVAGWRTHRDIVIVNKYGANKWRTIKGSDQETYFVL